MKITWLLNNRNWDILMVIEKITITMKNQEDNVEEEVIDLNKNIPDLAIF